MPNSRYSISLPPEIVAQVDARADVAAAPNREAASGRSGQIAGDLARYYEALARSRKNLRSQFSAGELSAILDICNGTVYEPHSIPWLYASMQDALEDGIAAKWEIDGPALVAKLRALSYIDAAALIDAAERAWRNLSDDGALNASGMLA